MLQRAAAAFLAIADRFRSDSEAARAKPPLDAPSLDSATAAGFLTRSGSFGSNGEPSIFSPIRSSMTDRASRFGSRGRVGLLAREGMVYIITYLMSQIQLALYSVRVKRQHGRSNEITSNFRQEDDLIDFLKTQLSTLQARVSKNDSEKQVMQVTKLQVSDREIEGVIETGYYGTETKIWDLEKGVLAFSKRKIHSELLPFYFLFSLPEAKDQGLLLVQRTGTMGIRKVLEMSLAPKFISTFEDYRLSFSPLIPEAVLEKYTGPNSQLKELVFIRHGMGSDIVDVLGASAKTQGKMQLSIRLREAGKFAIQKTVSKFLNGERELQNLIELKDETRFLYDNVKMVVVVDGKEKTVNLGNPKQFRAAYDASHVKLDPSGHPRFSSMSSEAKSIMDLARKQVWGRGV